MNNFFLWVSVAGFACFSAWLTHKDVSVEIANPYRQTEETYFQKTPDDFEQFEKRVWIGPEGDSILYRLLLPDNYNPKKEYPMVLFLHGAGERGNDNNKQLKNGAGLFLNPENRKDFPAIVVFPQCPVNQFWSNVDIKPDEKTKMWAFRFKTDGEPTKPMKTMLDWLAAFGKEYKIKSNQRYVMGLSMGGMGTFEIVRRIPDYFAAAIPICGGANPLTAPDMSRVAFWVFHGGKDNVVPPEYSIKMVEALKNMPKKKDIKFTMYPEANHNSWDSAFAEPALLTWMFKQKSNGKK